MNALQPDANITDANLTDANLTNLAAPAITGAPAALPAGCFISTDTPGKDILSC